MPNDYVPITAGTGTNIKTLAETSTGTEWQANVVSYVSGGSAGAWTMQSVDASHGLPVNVTNSALAATQSGTWNVGLSAGTNVIGHVIVDTAPTTAVTGTVTANAGTNLNTSALALETGGNLATTATNTTTIASAITSSKVQTNVAQVGGSALALGQQLAAASVPVVLTAAQLTTLTPVSTVTANIGTSGSLALDATLTAGTQKTKLIDTGGTNVASVSAAGALKILTDQTTHGTTDLVAADITKLGGTTVDTNSGVKSAGTVRVVIATDQPALTNKLLVTPDANSSVNVAQMNGVTVSMGNGVSGTGVQRVAVASDNTAFSVNNYPAGDSINIAGASYTVKNAFANATASGETTVVAAVAAKKIRVLAACVGPCSAAVDTFFDNATNGAIASTKRNTANGGFVLPFNPYGWFQTGTVNEALRINLSTTANVGVEVTYIEV